MIFGFDEIIINQPKLVSQATFGFVNHVFEIKKLKSRQIHHHTNLKTYNALIKKHRQQLKTYETFINP